MLSGRFVRRLERRDQNDVDLLVVGNVSMPELSALIKAEEGVRGTAINYTPMTEEELKFRKVRRDPFLQQIMAQSRIMIIGSDEDLLG